MKSLRHIWGDIKRGENIDRYVTIVISIVLISWNVLGSSPRPLEPFLLAVLAILAVLRLGDRYQLDAILRQISQPKEEFFLANFSTQQQTELESRIEKSSNLLVLGVALGTTLDKFYAVFRERLKAGSTIRVVLENPHSPACSMTAQRKNRPMELKTWRAQVQANLKALEELREETQGKLQIRVIDFRLGHGGILIDSGTPNGVFYLWYYSYKTRKRTCPKFILYCDKSEWYYHFVEEADALWENAKPLIDEGKKKELTSSSPT
ncbi:MAG: hypothetical protein L0331_29820 [Chloroflexi bacterium]|nr:hypothetical protein [Chloroflexota bacterium]MCI0649509.1 hypothetical protein [Chloroflexota bacterium]